MNRLTKITFILAGLLLFVAVLYIVISIFSNPAEKEPPVTTTFPFPSSSGSDAPLPRIPNVPDAETAESENALKQIVKGPSVGIALSKDENEVYYYKSEGGNLFKTDLEGEREERLSSLTIVGITEVAWHPDKTKAIVSYAESGEVKRFIHSVSSSTTSFFPKGLTSANWSPDGKRIAYSISDNSGSRAVVMQSDGKNAKTVFSDVIPDWRVEWISQTDLLLATAPTFFIEGNSYRVTQAGGRTPFYSMRGLTTLVNPSRGTALLGSADERGILSNLIVALPKNVTEELGARTLPEKCAWNQNGTALYCAVPRNAAAGLPDAWYRGEVSFTDVIEKIDIASGKVTMLLDSPFDADRILVDTAEKNLIMRDRKDGSIWRLRLESGIKN